MKEKPLTIPPVDMSNFEQIGPGVDSLDAVETVGEITERYRKEFAELKSSPQPEPAKLCPTCGYVADIRPNVCSSAFHHQNEPAKGEWRVGATWNSGNLWGTEIMDGKSCPVTCYGKTQQETEATAKRICEAVNHTKEQSLRIAILGVKVIKVREERNQLREENQKLRAEVEALRKC